MVRKIEVIRDRIMAMCGTDEAVIPVEYKQIASEVGMDPRTMQWRKPLRVDEIARMAATPEVRARAGRP